MHDAVPQSHYKTTTFVAAVRLEDLFAPTVVDGAMTGDSFAQYVRQELAPQLRPGDIVVVDNLSTHRVAGAREAILQRDAQLLFLPPYSPDFNPIEMVFSKIKNQLRRLELREVEELWKAFGASLDWIRPGEPLNYFRHSGYMTGYLTG